MHSAFTAGRLELALPENLSDEALEADFVSAAEGHGEGSTTAAGLDGDPSRTAADRA